jgi:hypothetical protein
MAEQQQRWEFRPPEAMCWGRRNTPPEGDDQMTTYVVLSGLGGELARRKVEPGDTVSNTLYLALARDCWDLQAGDVIRIIESED